MHRHRSIERLRARIGSALDLCSQLESGRQQIESNIRNDSISRYSMSPEEINQRSTSRCRCEASTNPPPTCKTYNPRRQADHAHEFQPASQDFDTCAQHKGRLIPKDTSYAFEPPLMSRTTPIHRTAKQQHNEANENTTYKSLTTRPCPFSPTRACPRNGPCPYATSIYSKTGVIDSTRRPCPYSPTNYCPRTGSCPYMPPPPAIDEAVCPYVAQIADAINTPPPPRPSPPPPCYRCKSPDYRCFSPTVCPLDPRPCIMSPRPCPFKRDQYALGCAFASNFTNDRKQAPFESRKCPYAQ